MFAESVRLIMQHVPIFIHNRVLIKVSFFVDNLRLPYRETIGFPKSRKRSLDAEAKPFLFSLRATRIFLEHYAVPNRRTRVDGMYRDGSPQRATGRTRLETHGFFDISGTIGACQHSNVSSLGLEQFGQDRIVQQLAARVAAQRLRISMSGHVHNLRGGCPGHVGRRHEPSPQTMRSDRVDVAR